MKTKAVFILFMFSISIFPQENTSEQAYEKDIIEIENRLIHSSKLQGRGFLYYKLGTLYGQWGKNLLDEDQRPEAKLKLEKSLYALRRALIFSKDPDLRYNLEYTKKLLLELKDQETPSEENKQNSQQKDQDKESSEKNNSDQSSEGSKNGQEQADQWDQMASEQERLSNKNQMDRQGQQDLKESLEKNFSDQNAAIKDSLEKAEQAMEEALQSENREESGEAQKEAAQELRHAAQLARDQEEQDPQAEEADQVTQELEKPSINIKSPLEEVEKNW